MLLCLQRNKALLLLHDGAVQCVAAVAATPRLLLLMHAALRTLAGMLAMVGCGWNGVIQPVVVVQQPGAIRFVFRAPT